ncbi:MAG: UDP-glucose 4-epimerase GalE [Tabrizicola sp.]|uniref:UDP-glucose 4-epimerase GalE n=1 Tax=Tabrizicola sp. TaxID=2005166 RepID=UPI0027335C84|nr:UDP-glucose 4-epimerase GalE [Tabrizicola sp.]MDP3261458.1 UDP-glucose 4-epimerase GalE [Tabrizicola sp.]MDP3649247.1 UDP-glucose 4-epimerase GalE [Paracoccaceae bacterium]MDZ4069569.1 UDP-glucose 4-epimerase GalE [Tabrizicola sp.]
MADRVLVTGGAGYIGAHACKVLRRAGFEPVAFDNLSTGWADAVRYGPLVKADLADREALGRAFAEHRPIAVMHFAALSLVGEAMTDPGKYWRANVLGALNLVEATVAAGCGAFVFSSTCATYGDQDGVLLDEQSPQHPLNAYGASKRAIEDILANFGASHGLRNVIFRYFNVAGADPEGEVGEQHRPETHLVPLVLETIDGKRDTLTVHGTDYPTPDGTCVRDYVHVMDLAEAHVLGLRWLLDGKPSRVFNLGSGRGFSVREVLDHARIVTNREVPVVIGPRRGGDAASLVSGSARAMEELGWEPTRSTMPQMITDAWRWSRGEGYAN